MLQAIRDRAQGFFAWVLLILIGVPFALWGIQNYFSSGQELPLAVVGDRDIYERDVTRIYEQTIANLPNAVDLDEKKLKRQALDRLIDEELIGQEAARKRLIVGDEAVRSLIHTLPYFQTEGTFDTEKYKTMLASQNLAPGQFAEQIRRALVLEQYQRAISDSSPSTDWQVKNFYRLKNQQRQIEYVTIPLGKLDRPITDQAVSDYYERHRSDFQEPETLVIDYLVLALGDLAAGVTPTDEELRAFYDEQKGTFTVPEERRVSHILITVEPSAKPEAEQAALAKIQGARDRIQKGEDFARVAKEVSEDPESAAKGGDLGIIRKETTDPNFEKAALSLGKDAVSEPVRTSFGYHLIKVTDLKPAAVKSFEEVKTDLLAQYQRNAVDSRFYDLGQQLTETSFEHPDSLEPAAKAIARPVERSQPFTREKGEGIATEKAVRDAAFSDDVLNGKNSELLELGPEKVAVVRVYERRPAVQKPLADVRADIVQRLRMEQAKEQTRLAAEEMRTKLQEGAAFPALAKASKLTLHTPAPIRRNAADLPAPLVEAVFTAPKPKDRPELGTVAMDDGAQVVYSVTTVIEQAPADADKEVEMLKNYLVNSAGQQQFAAWLAQMREAEDVFIAPTKQ